MENNQSSVQVSADKMNLFAATLLLHQKKKPEEVTQELINQGLDSESAAIMVNDLQAKIKAAKKDRAKKDMLYGALWCAGGTIATIADIGFIFWGAIVFGAIQFFKGLINL